MNPFTVNARHRLMQGPTEVSFAPPRKAEGEPMPVRRFLVMHFTAGWSDQSTIDWWRQPGAKGACAHIVIDRDGSVIQCRPFNQTAGHAGPSKWRDPKTGIQFRDLNHCSIGIELCNVGELPRSTYPKAMGGPLAGKPIPFITARHKHGGQVQKWEKFPEAQLDTARQIAAALVARYRLDYVVGHDDIAPDRKTDPGPAFPMTEFRSSLGFTHPL